jgi:hypothetical protein
MATVADLIAEARYQLGDESGIQWVDAKLVEYFREGQIEIYGRKPESVLCASDTRVTTSAPDDLTATTDTVALSKTFHKALVHYVCAKAFSEDRDDEHNLALSKKHEADYERSV